MPKLNKNILVLLACVVAVTGVGIYVTFYQQPQELDRVERAVQVAEMKQAEMSSLLAEYSTTREEAEEAVAKWQARYKVIPDTLRSPAVIGYLNDLSRRGFETFDITLDGVNHSADFSNVSVRVNGRGYYTSLYHLIWQLENNRSFYRVNDLNLSHIDLIKEDQDTGRERMQVMVSFSMTVNAYFGGPEGISAGSGEWYAASDEQELPEGMPGERPPVPASVLPDEQPAINPFFPIIMEDLPPNTHGLLDIDNAELISIADGKAVFRDEEGIRQLGVGDDVYLGQIISIDPIEGRVDARLNKGGIIDETRVFLDDTEEYRRIIGTERLRSLQ